jgi:beta-catenin-like protein 1
LIAIFENLAEFRPDICGDAAKQGLLQWLLRRLRVKLPFDGNKLYASEVLSILLQDSPDNRQMLGDLEGIDVILQQLAVCISDHSQWLRSLKLVPYLSNNVTSILTVLL